MKGGPLERTRQSDGHHDVAVLGGGPAGCAAAILLAKRGHDVVLVRPSAPPAGALAQSIPPSADKLLSELGLSAALERAGVHRNGGHTVWWAEAPSRVEAFEGGRAGFHVDRMGLEHVMTSTAQATGVRVLDMPARAVEEVRDEAAGSWVVRCRDDEGPSRSLRATWVLDATGRTGLLARREGRIPDRATTTLALVRRWSRAGGFADVDPTHTLVQSYEDGWAWSVPLDPSVRCFTAMVDPRHTDLSGMNLDASLDAELEKAGHVAAARVGATPLGPAWACPASLYAATRFGRPGLLLVGDAGSFIDPLSSFGVKKALSSGWLAAVVAHTALIDPVMTDTAVRFFDERERNVYRQYRARSASFFEACVHAYGHEYWTSRASAAKAARAASGGTADWQDADVPHERGVPEAEARRALERIQQRATLDASPGSTLREVERPTVRGHRVVLATHLASDRVPDGLRYVRNVDLEHLVEVAPLHAHVPDGWAAYNGTAPPVSLPDYLAALATAFAAGLLEHGGDAGDGR